VRRILALIRADALTSFSYRLQTIVWLGGLIVTIVPLYFVAQALQPTMASAIATEGQQYFGFLLIGIIAFLLLTTAVNALPAAIQTGIGRGTLEAMLATPTPLPVLLTGMMGFPLALSVVRGAVMLVSAWVLGAHVVWARSLPAFGILVLIALAHIPFAILAASLILAFRTAGPFATVVLTVSALLGGVYYPTQVVPSWLHHVSAFLPLTYGLRALRRTILDRASFNTLAPDLAMLATFTAVLFVTSLVAFSWALRHARRAGTLAQY
jgi:ABC-type multidrug transport system permease subunit